jgi:3-carboxy-cis,cis-muconate cycloisomerase
MTSSDLAGSSLLGPLFASREMRALFSDRASVGLMLAVEAALANAEAATGVIPRGAAAPIAAACDPARFDLDAIAEAAPASGNIAIPLVKALTAAVAKRDAEAARFVHWGATSQDIIDTATVLAIRQGEELIGRDLDRAIKALAAHARRNAKKPMAGRTWLQQALPITFGLKAARWAAMLARVREQLHDAATAAAVLQFGGAAGTLASLGAKGPAVAKRLAAELELDLPDMPWHGERDRIAALAAALGVLIGAAGKIARDISLLMQTEVAEVFEPAAAGRGGSSTMPHKRNPVACAQILAAATLAPGLVAGVLSGMTRSTNVRSAAGRRNGSHYRSFSCSLRASPRASPRRPRVLRSIPNACAPISRQPTASSWPRPCRRRSAKSLAACGRMIFWRKQANARRAKGGICAQSSPKHPRWPMSFPQRLSKRCSIPRPISAAPRTSSSAR